MFLSKNKNGKRNFYEENFFIRMNENKKKWKEESDKKKNENFIEH